MLSISAIVTIEDVQPMNKRFKLGRNNINGQYSSNLSNPEKLNFHPKESFRQ